jgi:hypothetical protein
LIGSTEGESANGQEWGQSIYAVSKQFCVAFGTCEPLSSVVDTILLASWQAGASAIKAGDCEQTRSILDEKIRHFLLFPLVHGVLYYAVGAASEAEFGNAHGFLIAYTQALLPYVSAAYADSVPTLQLATQPNSVIDIAAGFDAIRNAL